MMRRRVSSCIARPEMQPSSNRQRTQKRDTELLLRVVDLRTSFFMPHGEVRAVDGISFDLHRGARLGLVGESGCGKTVAALSILGLVPPPGRVLSGQILFAGRDLIAATEGELRTLRGNEIAMIFQEPMTSLNPVLTVGSQVAEAIRLHRRVGRRAAHAQAVDMLRLVEIPEAEQRADEYPHQMSGGMRQRVMIAMALSCNPSLLIADEPTTALDVTIQAQILDLLDDLRRRLGMSLLLVTHDLGVVAERTEEVAIMYAGRIVELGKVEDVFLRPLHPYTRGLLRCVPRAGDRRQRRLEAIPGMVPDLLHLPSGCRFRDRCPMAIRDCAEVDPTLEDAGSGHLVGCLRAGEQQSDDVRAPQ
jgi:oligopeptide/dipeptide ABC transporter ATP-binding protein